MTGNPCSWPLGNEERDDNSTKDGSAGALAATSALADERFVTHKRELHQQVIASLNLSTIGTRNEDELRREIRWAAERLCQNRPNLLSMVERDRLVNEVLDEIFGLGPLEALMRDPTISDILINGPKAIYVERNGCLESVTTTFNDEKHLIQTVQRMVGRVGRRVDETSPMVDARLARRQPHQRRHSAARPGWIAGVDPALQHASRCR